MKCTKREVRENRAMVLAKRALAHAMADGREAAKETREAVVAKEASKLEAKRVAADNYEVAVATKATEKEEAIARREAAIAKFVGASDSSKASTAEKVAGARNNFFTRRTPAHKILNAEMYSDCHLAAAFNINPPIEREEGGIEWAQNGKYYDTSMKYDRVSNCPLNREVAFNKDGSLNLNNVIQDGRLLPMYGGEDNDIKYLVKLSVGQHNFLHKKLIKVNFGDFARKCEGRGLDSIAKNFEEDVKSSAFFVNIEAGTIRKRLPGDKIEDGEELFVFGAWTPSAEKNYSALFYSFTEDIDKIVQDSRLVTSELNEACDALKRQISSNIDKVSGHMLQGIELENNAKLSARFCMYALAQGIELGNLLDGGSVMILNYKLDSKLEIQNKGAQDLLNVSNEAPDGAGYISSSFVATGLRKLSKFLWFNKEASSINFQARIKGVGGKIFAISVEQEDLEFFAKRQMVGRTEGKDYAVLGDGPIRAIFDMNAIKLAKFEDWVKGENLPKDMSVLALAIPHTTEGVSMNSQLANKISNTDKRDEVDSFLCDRLVETLMERISIKLDGELVRPYLTAKGQLFEVALASNSDMINSTLVRKSVLKELASCLVQLQRKGKVRLNGFYEHATCDALHALTNGIIDGVLGIAFDKDKIPMIEAYSRHAERKGIEEGVLQKCPSQGTEEHLLVKFMTLKELNNRIDSLVQKAIAEKGFTEALAKRAGVAAKNFVKSMGDGTILLPAFNIVKEMIAGMDYDYDAVSMFTDPEIIEAIKSKLRGCVKTVNGRKISVIGRACIIRYQKDLPATEASRQLEAERKVVKNNLSQNANKLVDKLFNNLQAQAVKESNRQLTGDYMLDLYHTAVGGVIFGSVIGKVVSSGDLATTLDDRVYFTDGKINELGMKAIKQLFKCIGWNKVSGKTYNSIFVDGVNKTDAIIGGIINDNVAIVEAYVVSKESVVAFVNELKTLDIEAMTLSSYQKMAFDFSFLVRGLGESAIDMLKKGDEVSLGVEMKDILASSTKLSNSLECKDNIDDVINYAVYKKGEEVLYNINVGEGSVSNFKPEEEAKKQHDISKDLEEHGIKEKVMLIDKFGVTKVKLLATLENLISLIASGFAGDENKNVSVYNWFAPVNRQFKSLIERVAKAKHISAPEAEAGMLETMFKVNKLLHSARGVMFDASVDKEIKAELKFAIVSEFESAFKCIEDKNIKDVLAFCLVSYYARFYFRGINNNSKFVKNGSFKNIAISEYDKNWRTIDSAVAVIFKVFGPLTALLFGDNNKVELEVFENKNLRLSLDLRIQAMMEEYIDFDYDMDYDEYRIFFKGLHDKGHIGSFNVPEGFEDVMDNIDNIHVELDQHGRRRMYTTFNPTFADLKANGKYSIVVLDRVVRNNEVVVVDNSIVGASSVLEKEFKTSYSVSVEENEKACALSTLAGKKVHMPSFYAPTDSNRLLSNREIEILDSNEVIGTSIVGEGRVKGQIAAAFDNVLVVKNN